MTAIAPIHDQRSPTPAPYTGFEKRINWHTPDDCPKSKEMEGSIAGINKRLDEGHARMTSIEAHVTQIKACIEANNARSMEYRAKSAAAWAKNTAETSEILDIISTAKGFFRGTQMIGSVLKWGLGIATAVIAFVLTIKSGGKL